MLAALISTLLIAGGWWLATDPQEDNSPDQTSVLTVIRLQTPKIRAIKVGHTFPIRPLKTRWIERQFCLQIGLLTPGQVIRNRNQSGSAPERPPSQHVTQGKHTRSGEPAVDVRGEPQKSKAAGVSKNRRERAKTGQALPRKRLRRDRKKTVTPPLKKKSSKEALTVPEF